MRSNQLDIFYQRYWNLRYLCLFIQNTVQMKSIMCNVPNGKWKPHYFVLNLKFKKCYFKISIIKVIFAEVVSNYHIKKWGVGKNNHCAIGVEVLSHWGISHCNVFVEFESMLNYCIQKTILVTVPMCVTLILSICMIYL